MLVVALLIKIAKMSKKSAKSVASSETYRQYARDNAKVQQK